MICTVLETIWNHQRCTLLAPLDYTVHHFSTGTTVHHTHVYNQL